MTTPTTELSQLQFYPMTPADLEQVMAIEQQAYQIPWTQRIFSDCLKTDYACCLMRQAEDLLAYGVMSVAVGEAHILNICVQPRYQGQQLGYHLMLHLIKLAKKHGAKTMFLEVRPSNRAACALYEKLGFNEVGLRKNYYPAEPTHYSTKNQREDARILALELAL
ncbi:ribosomal protein S18-alanine N-acetyltransferase [Candidatus Venteria ishoeyi]|uniref:ribosomal protein S18-alanine N-acetyltransferase n=1 Tax=Candidatus Venteria ishoeyi TaxID=1899563 RepID=UPI0025A5A35F|nr:ribosomal protein S18-alanine N-acetyltransferase [Candidatus Venteria ishoeyi]MDM8546030.1 ribosomal protein S18-alanine N-acetyltransferase [Candidatus Venteria ishoeyi]